MKLLLAFAVLATTGSHLAMPAPAGAEPLHPSIEDRRQNDTTLYAPAVPYAVETWRGLPRVPAGKERGVGTRGREPAIPQLALEMARARLGIPPQKAIAPWPK
jgi:hypothetical protein